jgi:hypothetical protein
VCGNGACEAGETETNCPADCGGAVCGNGICDAGESTDTCLQDCPCTPGCDASGNTVLCGTENEVINIDCPDDHVSTCIDVGGEVGYWCSCGSVPAAGICYSIPDLSIDGVACGTSGYLLILDCYEDIGSACSAGGASIGCTCGSVGAGGLCHVDPLMGEEYLLGCEGGLLSYGICPQGSACGVYGGVAACYCDDAADSYCPPADGCPSDPDCEVPTEYLEVVKPATVFLYGSLLGTVWVAKMQTSSAYDCPDLSIVSSAHWNLLVNCSVEGLGGVSVTGDHGWVDGAYVGFTSVRVAGGPLFDGELASCMWSPPGIITDFDFWDGNPTPMTVTWTPDVYDVWVGTRVSINHGAAESDCIDDVYTFFYTYLTTIRTDTGHDYSIWPDGIIMNASERLPHAGTIMVTVKDGDTVLHDATVTFDASSPATCQVQVTVGGVTRTVTVPAICS